MKKRILSIMLSFVLIVAMLLTTVQSLAATPTPITISANKTKAYPGDTVKYTVSIGAVDNMGGLEFVLNIPTGLTIVDNSIAIPDGLESTIDSDGAIVVPAKKNSYRWSYSAQDKGYTGTQSLVILTFDCMVDENCTLENKTVSMNMECFFDNGENNDNIAYEIQGATVKVEAKPIPVTGVTIDKTLSLKTGESASKTPSFAVQPENATNKAVSFTSSDPSVATVDATTGKVTGVKEGQTTITIKTAEGNFTDTCLVTVACSHANKTNVPEQDSDCKTQGWDEYVKCEDCGQLFETDGTTEIDSTPYRDLSNQHTGGTKTCTAQAVCTVCNQPYGERAPHSYTATTKKEETLKTAGNCRDKAIYYYSCDACGIVEGNDNHTFDGDKVPTNHVGGTKIINDTLANHKTQTEGYTGDKQCLGCQAILERGTAIDPGAHTPGSDYQTNGTHHWKVCNQTDCGVEIEGSRATHTGGEATCKKLATCSVCQVSYGSLDTNNHKNTEIRDAVKETCNTAGYTGDTWCKDCNTKIADGKSIDATGAHVDADGKWESNGTQHFHTCECGTKFDYADHAGGEATCKNKAVCSTCQVSYGATNPSNHKGDTYLVGEKKATCKAEGYTGDTYCSDCNTKLSDGKTSEKAPHVVNEWTISEEATVDKEGEKSGTCVECKTELKVTTAKLVSEIQSDNIVGVKAEVEAVGDTNISADVYFVANEVQNSLGATEKTNIENAIKKSITSEQKFKFAAIFDLKLMLREKDQNGDAIAETELDLNGTVKVTIPVPTDVLEKLTDVKLVHIKDNGEVELIPFTLANGKATFEAKEFSYYTFIGTEKVPAGDSNVENNITPSPQTGDYDNMFLWMAWLWISGTCLATCVVLKKENETR